VKLDETKNRNDKLMKELQRTHNDFADMRKEKEEKEQAYEEVHRNRRAERGHTFQVKQVLVGVSKKLAMRKRKRMQHWK